MKAFSILLSLSFLVFTTVGAQINPVQWDYKAKKVADNEYEVVFTAKTDEGWNIYSQHTDPSGPIPTSFIFDENPTIEFIGEVEEKGKKKEGFDDLFGVNVIKFAGEVLFTQKVKTQKIGNHIKGYLEYMCCDDERCLPPKEVEFDIVLE